MGEVAILHAEDSRRLACRLAAELAGEGHSVLRREAGVQSPVSPREAAGAADAVILVWSSALIDDPAMIDAARHALARRALAPVRIGDVEPPASFRHLWPIDLDGWTGGADDPRWQFVRDEVALAMRRSELALTPPRPSRLAKSPPAARSKAAVPPRVGRAQGTISLRAIPAMAAALAVSVGALINAAPGPSAARRTAALASPAAPLIAYVRPAADAPDEDPQTDEIAGDLDVAALAEPGSPGDPTFLRLAALEFDAPSPTVEAAPAAPASETMEAPPEAVAPLPAPTPDAFTGVVFRDCLACPDMAELPAAPDAAGAASAMSRREISFEEWRACVADGACRPVAAPAGALGAPPGRLPVVNVAYEDAVAYAEWLSRATGRAYRLPTEAEWEFAAGGDAAGSMGNHAGAAWGALLPTASFSSSAYGLYDMAGNAAEWTSGCAAGDGEPCPARIVRGGSFAAAAGRIERRAGARAPDVGFRVVRSGS